MPRRATAQDVADLAGVSRSAVSLVLNGHASGNISSLKQQAVLAAAAQLNYTPNSVALSLRSQRTRTLGVLSWPGRSSLGHLLLHGAWQRAQEDRYLLLMMDTNRDHDQEQHQLETLRNRQVDGFLVIAPEMTEYEPADLLLSVPTVLLNCVDAHGALTSVVPDDVGAGRRAAEVLLDRGHRGAGLLVSDPESLQTQLRVRGVHQAFAAAGLPLPTPQAAGIGIDDGHRAAYRLLGGPDRPTALICVQERLAVGAVLAAAQLRLPIPRALSLVSLEDGEQLAPTLVPPLTTVRSPDTAMAEQAVALLVERLAAPSVPEVRQLVFRCLVRHRASVAAPADSGGARASR